jgi:hypothetical protein
MMVKKFYVFRLASSTTPNSPFSLFGKGGKRKILFVHAATNYNLKKIGERPIKIMANSMLGRKKNDVKKYLLIKITTCNNRELTGRTWKNEKFFFDILGPARAMNDKMEEGRGKNRRKMR